MARWGEVQWALGEGVLPSEKLGLVNQGQGDPRSPIDSKMHNQHKVRSTQGEVRSAGIRN